MVVYQIYGSARFTRVPLKPLSNNNMEEINVFQGLFQVHNSKHFSVIEIPKSFL